MCADPVTMMIVGAGISAGGQLYGGISANKMARENAAALEGQAQLRIAKGEYEVDQAQRKYVRDHGTKVAAAAASGVDLTSFADVFADDAAEAALERETIRYGAKVDANNIRTNANSTRQQGKNAFLGSVFSATGTALSAAGRARLPSADPYRPAAWGNTSVSYEA